MESTTLDIIKGIAQAASNSYDGAHIDSYTADGKGKKVGLKREEGNPLIDSRVMDGFGIKLHGNKLIINYHSQVQLKDVYANNFENDIDSMIEKIATFLKKEYKAVTGKALTLKQPTEVDVMVQNASRIWSWCTATKTYTIGNVSSEEVGSPSDEKKMDVKFKKFLEDGGFDGKRPENDTRKKSE